MSRLETNRRLVEILARLVESNPTLRFGQILRNNSFVKEVRPVRAENGATMGVDWQNEFYLESDKLLERVNRCLANEDD